jgi:hypothetical protein
MPSELRAGLDLGATSADGVLMDPRGRLVSRAKVPDSGDLRRTLDDLLDALLADAGDAADTAAAVTQTTLATGFITDALMARRGLMRVAVLRIGGPLTTALPPLWGWPEDLRAAVSVGEAVIDGGAEYDGRMPTPLDAAAVRRFLDAVRDTAGAIAVSGVFSPVTAAHERQVTAIVQRELGIGFPVSASHEIASLGLLERENAAVLNAALFGPAQELGTALTAAMTAHGMPAEPYVAQNDGTAMALDHALRFPVLTIGSGPAVAMRGAARLSGVSDAVVVDVGGTRTDVGVLVNGYPREAVTATEIAGMRTGYRMPELWMVPAEPGLSPAARAPALRDTLAAVDVLELDGDDGLSRLGAHPVVAVGGGARLAAEALRGDAEVIVPADGELAGAIGAAIAGVSGQADLVCDRDAERLQAALVEARETAIARAIHAGADPARLQIIEVEETPLTYLAEPGFRVRVRVAGPCAPPMAPAQTQSR